ncbi:minor capsid protein [Deinococcus sp. Marseille-Q6407]|uniref:minor capsid protein n=1 Tax=Deinococcus sp. Marseille-Q6407 TaxID=2969223 RepID=UPI0021C08227|nr:minor capsid protein [Deinococcus sp. Marseille-Q6407]
MKPTPEQRRLLTLASEEEEAAIKGARGAILRQYQAVSLDASTRELARVLGLPLAQRRRQLPKVLALIDRATAATRTPPAQVWHALERAVGGRILSVDELARLSDPSLQFNSPGDLQARAVDRQRRQMNRYWDKEGRRFRNDVAKTVRQAARQGLDPERAADLLQERLGVSRGRAVLIATDQLRTAAAWADEQRQKQLGLKSYIWWTLGDKKVRGEHRARHGRIYRWGQGERPGQAVNCRCRALPVPRSRQE